MSKFNDNVLLASKNDHRLRRLILLGGYSALLVYFIFSVVFFRDRICFADTANMFFKIVQTGWFNIEAGRYPQVITQILVVPAVKLGMPLSALMLLYSISFPLFYLVIFILVVYVYRNATAGLVLIFSLIGCIRMGFFHTGTETHQALAWAALFIAWLMDEKPQHGWKRFLEGGLLAMCCLHAHPVGLFLLTFSLGHFWISVKDLRRLEPYFFLGLIALLSLYKVNTTETSSYEGMFLSRIGDFPQLILHLDENRSLVYFLQKFGSTFRVCRELFIVGLIWMIWEKKFLKALYMVAFTVGFWIFTLLIYHTGDSNLMMERAFMPLAFFVGWMVFTQLHLSKTKWINVAQSGLVVYVFFQSFTFIHKESGFMQDRFAYMEEVHQSFGAQKICLSTREANMTKVVISWSYCLETLLYSTSKHGKPGSYTIAILPSPEGKASDLNDPNAFIAPDFIGTLRLKQLNANYFSLPAEPYVRRSVNL